MSDRLRAVALFKEEAGNEKLIEGWVEGPIAEGADLRGINTLMLDFYDEPAFVQYLFEFVLEMELGLPWRNWRLARTSSALAMLRRRWWAQPFMRSLSGPTKRDWWTVSCRRWPSPPAYLRKHPENIERHGPAGLRYC